jgi:hypothetical protein
VVKRRYYDDCSFSDRFLFAIFMGKREIPGPHTHDISERGASYIHVFDLDGGLVRVLRVDRPLTSIAANAAGTVVFGASVGEAAVFRIRVPAGEREAWRAALVVGQRLIGVSC